jgi:ketosteroid isomerase-like protein
MNAKEIPFMPDGMDIEQLVARYLRYWEQTDIDGLISMYDSHMSYHDMPSGNVIEYANLKQFLTNTFAQETNQQLKLKDSVFVEGNSAFICWLQSFSSALTGKHVKVNGVELIVFRDEKIISIHEFYDYQISALEEFSDPAEGADIEKMNKLGLDNDLMQTIATR